MLLLVQFPITGGKTQEKVKPDLADIEEKHAGNLGQLEARTRVVHGVREPCLKILPSKEIKRLEFSLDIQSSFPVKSVLYKSDADASYAASISDPSQPVRFNLFTGNQTLHEREESFK